MIPPKIAALSDLADLRLAWDYAHAAREAVWIKNTLVDVGALIQKQSDQKRAEAFSEPDV